MQTWNAAQVDCFVFTFKEGLFSRIAHDLKIRVESLTLIWDDATRVLTAVMDAHSLRVVCAMQNGVEAAGVLSAGDRAKIETAIVEEVLEAKRFPEIRFEARDIGDIGALLSLRGHLYLHGQRREVSGAIQRSSDGRSVEFAMNQTDFGIRPFSAMLGTLKIKSEVLVRVKVPWTA